MGINELWKLVDDLDTCNLQGSLQRLTIQDGFSGPKVKPYVVGIDASIWIYQAASTFAAGHAQAGFNSELPEQLNKKRSQQVSVVEHWLVDPFIKLIIAVGFQFHRAPREAEAELALLNKIGSIDTVMTEDSDAFVFSAKTILRKSTKNGASITDSGVPGCRSCISLRLACYIFGQTLCTAAETLNDLELCAFAINWHANVANCLLKDPKGYIGCRCISLTLSLSSDFPNVDIIKKLLFPKTSQPPLHHDQLFFQWDLTTLLRIYKKKAWPGLVTHMLTLEAIKSASSSDEPLLAIKLVKVSKNDFDDECPCAWPAAIAQLAYDDFCLVMVCISSDALVLSLHLTYILAPSSSSGSHIEEKKAEVIDLTMEDVEFIDFAKDEQEMVKQDREFIDLTVGGYDSKGKKSIKEVIDLTGDDED
ncbi:PIN domain-like protein [Abortiporus biennis]|nr:PIN domain-like protein [Abortiporus biennis]